MVVTITISLAGAGTGPFDLYSNSDGFLVPFETGVSKAALEAGYITNLVPNDATLIRVVSVGACTDYVTVSIAQPVEPTTTTTSTTVIVPTTSTTTTSVYSTACVQIELYDTQNELACTEPDLFNVYRIYRATLLNGPGGTPIAAPETITISIPTYGDSGEYDLFIVINTGDTFGEEGLYTRVYTDCSDRSLIELQVVNLNGATIFPNTYANCLEV